MKDFNKNSNPSGQPPKFVTYAEAPTALRIRMERLIDAIVATPFDMPMPHKYGAEPLAQLEEIVRNPNNLDAGTLVKKTQAVLETLDIYLGAADEILRLYTTKYAPMTYGGCVDVGAMIKENFEKRFTVLQEASDSGHEMLAALENKIARNNRGPRP